MNLMISRLNKCKELLVLTALLAISACSGDKQAAPMAKPVLTEREVATLELDAKAGDQEAVLRLAEHFEFASGQSIESKLRAEHWIRLGAETGDESGIQRYVALLVVTKRCDDALTWFRKTSPTAAELEEFDRDLKLCQESAAGSSAG